MSRSVTTPFVFALTTPGSEALLKRELASARPELKLAFSRPGFVTFKTPEPVDASFELGSVFAREFGASFGPLEEPSKLASLVERLCDKPRLAVLLRSAGCFADTSAAELATITEKRAELEATNLFAPGPPSKGDVVVDVALHPGERPWLGAHVMSDAHPPDAGGLAPVTLPPEAPSRAYLKIEEAIRRFRLPLAPNQHALELGSAPGGASYALLQRGLEVLGIDPGNMGSLVLSNPAFRHLQVPVGGVKKHDLPKKVDWLVLDMNLAPPVSLRYLERLAGPLRASLRGCVLTLKLNEPRMVDDIPKYLARVASMGFVDVRATQLPSNGQEICVVARGREAARVGRI